MKKYAYATVATNKTYIISAARLYQRLKYIQSKYPLIIIVTDNVSKEDLKILHFFNIPYIIKPYYHFYYKEEGITYYYEDTINKFHILSLINYEKICFLDADIIPQYNIDYIFCSKFKQKTNFIIFGDSRCNKKLLQVSGGFFLCKPNLQIYNFIMNNQMIIHNYQNDEELLSKLFYNTFTYIPIYDFINISHFSGGPMKLWSDSNKNSFFYFLFNNSSEIDFNLLFDKYLEQIEMANNAFELYQSINTDIKNDIGKINNKY